VISAFQLFEEAILWLKNNYGQYHFFTERDIVWMLQLHLIEEIQKQNLSLQVFDNHKVRSGIQVDLAIVSRSDGSVPLVAELKYEPDHRRVDISHGKLNPSKVFWDSEKNHGVVQDYKRIVGLVDSSLTYAGFVLFIDEGGHHAWRDAPTGCIWCHDWGKSPYSDNEIAALFFKYPGGEVPEAKGD
jgi:hypothetical protein